MMLQRYRAGALQFVLFVGAVIAVLLLTFVMLTHSNFLFRRQTDRWVAGIEKADAALEQALQKSVPGRYTVSDPLPSDEPPVLVMHSFWGIFSSWQATVQVGNQSFTKQTLSGATPVLGFPALYLRDNGRPMVIAGNSRIVGDVAVPQRGIRPGSIGGRYYSGINPYEGEAKVSTQELPLLPEGLRAHLKTLVWASGPGGAVQRWNPRQSYEQSFALPTLELEGQDIYLAGTSLTGNIRLRARGKIVVSASARLADVVLIAPVIELEPGVRGNFQAVATRHITVGKGVRLGYPSALVLVDTERSPNAEEPGQPPKIVLEENTEVRGTLLYLNEVDTPYFSAQIQIKPGATVTGQVYCEKNLELQGLVRGTVITDAFIAIEKGGIYQNHLYDGQIRADELHPGYSGLPVSESYHKTWVKWLY